MAVKSKMVVNLKVNLKFATNYDIIELSIVRLVVYAHGIVKSCTFQHNNVPLLNYTIKLTKMQQKCK